MKPKTIILMVVAVACGLVASYMTSRLLADRAAAPAENQVTVVIAKKKVPAFTTIKNPEEFFEVQQVTDGPDRAKAIRTLDDLRGKRLKRLISDGAMVRTDDLASKEDQIIEIPKGQRAIAIKVNPECLAGGFILPGMRVDIICTIRRGDDPTSLILLQNMLVMAIDTTFQRQENTATALGQTCTLAATPEECERLSLAAQLGELRLTLRSPEDTKLVNHGPTKPDDLRRQVRDRNEKGEAIEVTETAGPSLTPLPVVEQPKPQPTPDPTPEVKVAEQPKETHRLWTREGAREQTFEFVKDPATGLWQRSSGAVDDVPAVKPTPRSPVVPDPQPAPQPAPEESKPTKRKTK
jgi:pilus assembly protein CpaB